MIKVSIITPSYNQGQFIERTILSVLNQTYSNIEYIIMDGGSTDNTMEIVNKYRDKIDIIVNENDKGQTDAINKGFRLAKGELLGWINSDDILYPDCVEQIVKLAMKYEDGAIYYSSKLSRIDSNDQLIEIVSRKITGKNYLLNRDYSVIQQASFYRSSVVKKVNYLDEKINFCMDLDLWLKLLNNGRIYSIDEKPLGAIRKWEETKTSNGGVRFISEIRNTLKKHGASFYSFSLIKLNNQLLRFKMKSLLRVK